MAREVIADFSRIMNGSYKLVLVTYIDHLLFKNTDVTNVYPCVRDGVGWIVRETDSYLVLCSDMPSEGFEYMSIDLMGSGIVILKNCIVEMKTIAFA
jgi:hypothetical protein